MNPDSSIRSCQRQKPSLARVGLRIGAACSRSARMVTCWATGGTTCTIAGEGLLRLRVDSTRRVGAARRRCPSTTRPFRFRPRFSAAADKPGGDALTVMLSCPRGARQSASPSVTVTATASLGWSALWAAATEARCTASAAAQPTSTAGVRSAPEGTQTGIATGTRSSVATTWACMVSGPFTPRLTWLGAPPGGSLGVNTRSDSGRARTARLR
mmetsp:Transcript_51877/g.157584  ORF Transcript_51877/g.157584 Transcript_51877/m.157584 type:complete len:213 (+) Transcript_51877:1539-2177(+)